MTTIPGANLFTLASQLIRLQDAQVLRRTGRTKNNKLQYVTAFADPVAIRVSAQPLIRSVYKQLGLDFKKTAIQFYTNSLVEDLERDGAGDNILYDGRRFEVISYKNWRLVDGWLNIIAVEIPLNIPSAPS